MTPSVVVLPSARWPRRLVLAVLFLAGLWALLAAAAQPARAAEGDLSGTCGTTELVQVEADAVAGTVEDVATPGTTDEVPPPPPAPTVDCEIPPPVEPPSEPVPAPGEGTDESPPPLVETVDPVPAPAPAPAPAPEPIAPVEPAPVAEVVEAVASGPEPVLDAVVAPEAAPGPEAVADSGELAAPAVVEAETVETPLLTASAATTPLADPPVIVDLCLLTGPIPPAREAAGTTSSRATPAVSALRTATTDDSEPPEFAARTGALAGLPGPGTPAGLPAPVPAPAPVGPSGPAGPAAASASGAWFSGAGHTDHHHVDTVGAVVDAQLASAPSRSSVRATSGFAGPVVGGADDPGVRPG